MNNFTLFSLFKIALNHILALLLTAVVFAVATFSYCEYLAEPKYSATGSVLVTNGAIVTQSENSSTLNNTDIVASLNFVDTVIDILKTNGIYQELSKLLDYKYSYEELVSISNVAKRQNDTLFIDVTFNTNNKEEAIKLVNTYLTLVPDYINVYVPGSAAVVTTNADTAAKTYPKTTMFTLSAAVLGAVLAFCVVLIIYSTNSVIQDEDDFKEHFDVEVIGCIPDFESAKSEKYYKYYRYYNYSQKGKN